MRQLTLCYGIYPTLIEQFESTDDLVTGTVKQLVKTKRLAKDDFIVILGATPGAYGHATNFLEINTVKNCLKIRS
jgi:pyruvate kinase